MTTTKENMAAPPVSRNPGHLTGGEDFMVNRQHKDRLFRMIFRDKKDLLSLYNAVNGSHYTDPKDLEITTIEDVLYMGMKNDVSFLIEEYLNLYEAQSTWNPNMPLRGVFYFPACIPGISKPESWTFTPEPEFCSRLPGISYSTTEPAMSRNAGSCGFRIPFSSARTVWNPAWNVSPSY